jgi:hypothetical protein
VRRHANLYDPAERLAVDRENARRHQEHLRLKALAAVERNAHLFRPDVSHEYVIEKMRELKHLPDHEADRLIHWRLTDPNSPWVPEMGFPPEDEPVDTHAAPNAGSSPRGDRMLAPSHPRDWDAAAVDPFAQAAEQIRYDRM